MKFTQIIIVFLFLASCSRDEGPISNYQRETRQFYIGFTAFPYDDTVQAQLDSYENAIADGDIFLNHLDHGVPWEEALNDLPFPEEVQNTLNATKTGLGNAKILLTATATDSDRKTLAKYWNDTGSQQPLPASWQNKTFDDSEVVNAYSKYCKRIIEEVQPDYFAYGIEINAAFQKDDDAYAQYLTLASTVYQELKMTYPALPIFLTFQDRSFENSKAELLETTETLLRYSDYIAMSTYPFLDYADLQRDADPDMFSDTWLADFRNLDTSKPFAISETGFCAEPLVIENLGVKVKATEEWQAAYLDKLFLQAEALNAEFVLWFIHRDYDLLYGKTPNPPDIFKVWKDTGLLDGDGRERPSYKKWQDWKALTKNPTDL